MPNRPSVQLLKDCHLTKEQVIEVIENDIGTRMEKNIDSFNSPCGFCHVTTDGTANSLLLQCIKCLSVAHLSCLVCNYKKSCKVSLENSINWLGDFISSSNFKYICPSCVSKNYSHSDVSECIKSAPVALTHDTNNDVSRSNSVCYDVNTCNYNDLHSCILIDNFVSNCNIISKALDSVNNNILSLSENITKCQLYQKMKNCDVVKESLAVTNVNKRNILIFGVTYCSNDSDAEVINCIARNS